jgi:large subunit ribosomal protein L1
MAAKGKRLKQLAAKVDRTQFYDIAQALELVRSTASARFDESVDVAVNLGVNARKSDQNVRGATVLPRGTGKTVRVAVFAEGEDAEKATAAGADIVGLEDLAERIQKGEMDFDRCIATPATMRVVGRLGQILGPRGLMPNPKVGTVTTDVATAVRNAKAGQIQFRIDKAGIIHCPIGKASFDVEALRENLDALLASLVKAKPSTAKGQYVRRVTLSTTMGPGVRVDRATLDL